MTRTTTFVSLVALTSLLAFVVPACGGGPTTGVDGGDASAPEGGRDATKRDAGLDARGDSSKGNDAKPDVAPDVTADVTGDVSADVSGDVGPKDGPSDGPRTLDGGFCDGGAFTVAKVDPVFGWTGGTTPITITGTGFVATPTVYLRNTTTSVITYIPDPAFVSATSISAIVPSGLAVGAYDVAVVDPDMCAEFLAAGFNVVKDPPPEIIDVSPAAGVTSSATSVTVTGCDFPTTGAGLDTVDATGAIVAQTGTITVVCTGATGVCADGTMECTMTATIDSTKLTPGAYVVRVTNPAESTYGDWSSFVVTNPSGKLTGSWLTANSLNTGRRSLALVSGRINTASRFLYAVGGEDATGTALKTVEVAPLDEFGQIGTWFVQGNQMNLARSGLAVVRQGQYLYAIGGTSSAGGTGGAAPTGTPLTSIERAKILDSSTAPVLSAPTTGATGTLAKGTWYYKVSAVMGAGFTDNPGGETLPSNEGVVNLTAAGSVSLSWTAVTGAASYDVYRSPAADGASQTELLTHAGVTTTTYTDTGDTAGTQKPLGIGSTGIWVTQSVVLTSARLNTAAVIAPDPSAGLHVYVVGGWGTCLTGAAAIMNCYETTTLTTAGDALGATFTPDIVHTLTNARMRHGIAAMTALNGPSNFSSADGGAGPNAAFVMVSGGAGLSTGANTAEYSLVGAGPLGALGAWASPGGFALQRDGSQLQIVNGYAYAFLGGKVGAYTSSSDISITPTLTPTTLTFGSWSNAAVATTTNIGRHGVAEESAFFYVAGGTTNDTDALTSVYQIIY